ncbi:MAG: acylneuraminate cytidylyltransferase family protein [Candidatus Omnitrophota bacterium]
MIVLGIIPARGGSKAIPLKNIKELCGKPLLEYTIESAKRSGCIDRLVVSTDHRGIADLAARCGAEVVMRPEELSKDDSPTEPALIHVLDEMKRLEGFDPDVVLTLEPTSPLRSASLIKRGVEIFRSPGYDSVIGVVESRSCYGRIRDGEFEFLFPGQSRRRQEREPLYRESGTIYGTRTAALRRKRSVIGDNVYPLIIPESEAIDINTQADLKLAEALINMRGNRMP